MRVLFLVQGIKQIVHLNIGVRLSGLALILLLLVGCTEHNGDQQPPVTTKSNVNLGDAPAFLTRAVDTNLLRPVVTINGISVIAQRSTDGSWTLDYTLFDSSLNISMQWVETYNSQDLVLASWSGSFTNITSDSRFTIDSTQYRTDIHDADADGISNLAERVANTDPYGNSIDLQGTWFGECELAEDGDSSRTVVVFDDSQFKNYTRSSFQYIGTTTCVGTNYISVNLESVASIPNGVTNTLSGDAQHIDITHINGTISAGADTITALEAENTTLQEVASTRGFDNVDFITLAELMVAQAEVYTIYQIVAGELRLGVSTASRNGESSAARHNVLSTVEKFDKQ